MKAAGIVVEYNPFHNGHIYHIEKTRQLTGCDVVIACMSGNFVQRGQPAIIDKWQRTACALEHGVDLVLELPFAFVCQSATQFGSNAIDILARAGVDSVVFGSETGNLEELQEIASLSFNIDNFKENMMKGYSYPASYGYMATDYGPNDILAISYLRALQKYPQIRPFALKRESDYLDDELHEGSLPSALAIRKALKENKDVSSWTPMAEALKKAPEVTLESYWPLIRTILLTHSADELREIFLVDEGIENLLIKKAYSCTDFSSFMNECVTRRYTRSRIQRTLCQIMVHNTRQMMNRLPEYDILRVLGFNEKGRQYLKDMQGKGVRFANHFTANIKPYRDLEYRTAVLYSMNMDSEEMERICRREIDGLY